MSTNDAVQVDDLKEEEEITSRPVTALFIMIVGLAVLMLMIGVSISLGAAEISLKTVWTSLVDFDPALTSHQIIYELRMPRAIAGAFVGAFLAVSGAIMQGMTRNPLADSSIMGVTNGSAFAIAVVFAFFPGTAFLGLMIASFIGAGFGAGLVFGIGSMSKGGLTPVKLALAGTAIGAFLSSISSAIAIHFNVAQDISFWYAGGLVGTKWLSIQFVLPFAIGGLLLALFISRSVTIMSLGEDVAKGLGQLTGLVRFIGVIVVLLLTGAAVSIAGTVGFLGLIIPHLTRFLVGVDYRFIIPCSAILGALLLVVADIAARMINPPFEIPVGVLTALLGVPFFLYIARKEGRGFM